MRGEIHGRRPRSDGELNRFSRGRCCSRVRRLEIFLGYGDVFGFGIVEAVEVVFFRFGTVQRFAVLSRALVTTNLEISHTVISYLLTDVAYSCRDDLGMSGTWSSI